MPVIARSKLHKQMQSCQIHFWIVHQCILGRPGRAELPCPVISCRSFPSFVLPVDRAIAHTPVRLCCRGLRKHGGRLRLNAHVDRVEVTGNRATGVTLADGTRIHAGKAVVSNASMWDTLGLLPAHAQPPQMARTAEATPKNRSFMHLHAGFDATGLEGLGLHHIVVNSWEGGVDTEQVPGPASGSAVVCGCNWGRFVERGYTARHLPASMRYLSTPR